MKISVKENEDVRGVVKDEQKKIHKMSLDELKTEFATSLADGLIETDAAKLLIKYGKNIITQKKKNPFLKIISYFFTGFCGLIWVAAIICILAWKPIGNPPDPTNLGLGVLLIFVIFLQASFTAFQDWSSNKVMKSIKNMMPHSAVVVRNGLEKKISIEELVIGDLVKLVVGNKVPADVRIIDSKDLSFDRSMLTGETKNIKGTVECTSDRFVESKNVAFMGTLITNGQGKGIVIAVGGKTLMGRIACLTDQTKETETSLQKELKRFVFIIATSAMIMAVIVVIVWTTWLRVHYPNYIDVPSLLVNTISVMIAFIPEGLPVCVTLSLLIIAKRMAKNRVLVKNLSVIETLSCVNVIASDKTGTLTQNKMFVSNASVGTTELDLNDGKSNMFNKKGFNQLILASGLCNNATFEDEPLKNIPIRQKIANGDATDIALLRFSSEYENIDKIRENSNVLAEIPFNSKNKWMMKIIRARNKSLDLKSLFDVDKPDFILLKGAPDYLLKKSSHIISKDGLLEKISVETVNEIIKLQNEWCIKGQRVLLICKKSCDYSELAVSTSEIEDYINRSNDFSIIGLVGIIDPPREGIADVLSQCKTAGIKVLMVTGDYALTAAAIAYQIGIFSGTSFDTAETMKIKHKINHESYDKSSLLLTGNDLEYFQADDWRLVTPYQEIVFARTTPEQKLNAVKEFQRDGYTVAVTGDGVNDAPALKSADIGIAMGSGSEVAIEAAQLVLLDNNFSSILIAIRNGRLVFQNLRKVILYLLPGGCMAELVPVLIAIFLGVPQNLSSFQMIVISLFTDIAPSLSLMMEKEETSLLKQPPRSKKDHLVDWKFMLQAYLFLGTIIVFFSQTMFFIYMQTYGNLSPSDIILSFGSFLNAPIKTKNATDISVLLNQTYELNKEFFYRGQTVTFVSLVLLQVFGNLLSTRTHVKSFFQQPPWRKSTQNLWIFAAQFISIAICLIIIFVPFFHNLFNTRPIPVGFLFLPFFFCIIVIMLDEIRKLMVRKKWLYFQKIGW